MLAALESILFDKNKYVGLNWNMRSVVDLSTKSKHSGLIYSFSEQMYYESLRICHTAYVALSKDRQSLFTVEDYLDLDPLFLQNNYRIVRENGRLIGWNYKELVSYPDKKILGDFGNRVIDNSALRKQRDVYLAVTKIDSERRGTIVNSLGEVVATASVFQNNRGYWDFEIGELVPDIERFIESKSSFGVSVMPDSLTVGERELFAAIHRHTERPYNDIVVGLEGKVYGSFKDIVCSGTLKYDHYDKYFYALLWDDKTIVGFDKEVRATFPYEIVPSTLSRYKEKEEEVYMGLVKGNEELAYRAVICTDGSTIAVFDKPICSGSLRMDDEGFYALEVEWQNWEGSSTGTKVVRPGGKVAGCFELRTIGSTLQKDGDDFVGLRNSYDHNVGYFVPGKYEVERIAS